MLKRGTLGSLVTLSWLVVACGPSAADAVRPKTTSAVVALGEASIGHGTSCGDVTDGGRPLIVDWKPEQRSDLEVVMSQGIAVLNYDCHRIELLPDCFAEGSYGFKGVVLKQQLIRLQDEDEIRANLPLSGHLLAAQLKGELERGTTLDLAVALVGNLTGSRLNVLRHELRGRCQGATHFVRRANIGAFVMQTGERASLATAASLFGASSDAGSSSSRLARVEDGSVEACKATHADSKNPPNNCGALVRVHLLPIANEAERDVVAQDLPLTSLAKAETSCPKSLVLQDGKCTKPAAQSLHECKATDVTDCQAQCERNQPASCARLARLMEKGQLGTADPMKTSELFQKACAGDQADACSDLGIRFVLGRGVAIDPSQAAKLFEKACQLGEANGCFNLGNLYYDGQGTNKDRARAFSLFEQACNAGKPAGCINVGNMYDDGDGVVADSTKAFGLFKRACEGDAAVGCANLAYMYSEGKSVPQDQSLAFTLYEKSCRLGSGRGCEYAGSRYAKGEGVAPDPAKAAELFNRACELGQQSACSDGATPSIGTTP